MAAGFQLYILWFSIIRDWEQWRPRMVSDIFKRTAWICRYSRSVGFREAMGMKAWERNRFMDALQELIEEETSKGGISSEMLDD